MEQETLTVSEKKIKILVVASDRTGVSKFRSVDPHLALQEKYPDEFHIDIDYNPDINNDDFIKQYNIIHFHRSLGPYEHTKDLINRLESFGIVSFMDIDDYWLPGLHHPAHHIIKKNEIDKKVLNNIKVASNITTTTELFAKEISKFNKNVFVLPNAVNPKEKQFIPNPTTSDRLRVGLLWGSSHLKDMGVMNGMVNKLSSAGYMDKIQFVLCGFDVRGTNSYIDPQTGEEQSRKIKPTESVWYQYEKILTNNYTTVSKEYKEWLHKFDNKEDFIGVENEPYRRVWTKPITTYASGYNCFDVMLAPLEENIFNYSKSQLKVVEAGFHKKALIAQNFGPYSIDLKDAKLGGSSELNTDGNALLVDSVKNHKSWFQYIKMLVDNPNYVEILGDRLYNTVNGRYDMDTVTDLRRELYLSKIKNKP